MPYIFDEVRYEFGVEACYGFKEKAIDSKTKMELKKKKILTWVLTHEIDKVSLGLVI